MLSLDIFGDQRKIPKLSINTKIKVHTESTTENVAWNNVFGYIMRKPRTKLEFIAINALRKLQLDKITVENIKSYITTEDYVQLKKVERLFNTRLTLDVKAFVLSILKIPVNIITDLSQN